jgi:hypothetical protein
MSCEDNWTYGVIEEEKPKLQPLLDVLRRFRQRGLTAGMVAAAFHHRRVLPLMQHRLQIDEMTSEALLEESQMSHESLPLDEVVRRARWMVGSFKQEDIDRVPMRTTQDFEPLVSVVLTALGPFASQFSQLSWSRLPCRICRWSRSHGRWFRRIRPLERRDASLRPRRRKRRTLRRSVRSRRPSSVRR